jgi:transposase
MSVTAVRAAQQQTVALPGEAPTAMLVKKLTRQLLDVDPEIKDTDKLLTSRFREHPQAIIESLPGMGPILGAQFLVATSDRLLDGFANAGRLASYAGRVPVRKDSGRVTGNNHRPKRFNRLLRHVFHMMALSSIRPESSSKAFHQRKRDQNKAAHPGPARTGPAHGRRPVGTAARSRTWSPIPTPQITATAA